MIVYADDALRLYQGDAEVVLRYMADASVDCVVTSPPYWKLRNYNGEARQLGQEATPEEYVESLVDVFRELRRVLKPEGTAWLNVGDSYLRGELALVPQRLAVALQGDGWLVRSDVVWWKPNAIPDTGAKTRPGADHEYVYLLTKERRHYYDADAVREPAEWNRWGDQTSPKYGDSAVGTRGQMMKPRTKAEIQERYADKTKLRRATWKVPTANYRGAHTAVFPEALIEPMILSGCPAGGVVLDPFVGSGTTANVAARLGRRCVGIELSPETCDELLANTGRRAA